MAAPEANASLVRSLHAELLESRDLDTIDRYFARDFVSHNNPPGFPPGVEGVKRFFEMFRDAFPDATVTIDELVADGDKVAVATTLAVAGGEIVEHRGLTDIVGLMRQLTQ